ncbi:hypothetical protein BCR44DRAFT_1447970 [Catenaria anguillulae PL171]|uniref:Dbl homology domain-containing protein n=1 Tax=Catenaria anguillulae PL171 TaxID=765915 RepID=A0A1Y2H9M3_9FUNG|nr:hypothetical protein BCR44DRAFT_1447970 [Catenaria anguillulae PL171]
MGAEVAAAPPAAPVAEFNPFATIGRPTADSPPSPMPAPVAAVQQLNNPFDPFASPVTTSAAASDVFTTPVPAAPAKSAVLYEAWAMYDFEPTTPDDLALKEGQSLDIVEEDGDWVRAVTKDGKEGWVPLTYISRERPQSSPLAAPVVATSTAAAAAYMLYAYTATQDDELTVDEDAQVEIVDDKSDPDWWLVRCGDRQGLVPATYVERGSRPSPILHQQPFSPFVNTSPPATNAAQQPLHDPFLDPFSSSSSPDTHIVPPLAVTSATSASSTPSFLFPSSTPSSRPSSPDRFVAIPSATAPSDASASGAKPQSMADWLAVPSLRHKASAQSISSQATTWSSTMYPKLVESLAPGERARQEAIFELIKTEQAYVRDLQVVMDVFIQPLAHGAAGMEVFGEDKLRKQVVEHIFGPWEEVLVTNVAFLSDLELRQEMDDGLVGKPGEVVLEHIPAMKCYLPFCASQKAAIETLTKLIKDNAMFSQFLSQRQADPRCRSLDLGSYLLKPMQRLTRYPLLIKQILHHTPDTHSDHPTLLASLHAAEKVLYEVNEAARDQEDKVKFSEIATKVDLRLGSNVLDLRSSTKHLGKRHFIHEGPLAKAKSGRALYGYLFNDILLLCEERRSDRGLAYSVYRAPIPLTNVKVERDASRADMFALRIDGVDALQEVAGAGGLLAFKCEDQSSRNNWANKIDAASNAARAAAAARGAGAAEIMARPTLGTLQVTVVEGTHCRPVDPSVTRVNLLCEVSLPNETQRTRMVRNTTHPVWNQTLTLSVQSLDDVLRIVVFNSHDKYSEETYMGTAELPLHILEYYGDKETTQDLPLQNVPSGSVVRIKIQYRSLSRVRR